MTAPTRRLAAADPGLLAVGVDATADNFRRAARRGLPNLVLARLALEAAPGPLEGLADRVSVLLPWGSLLRAVAEAEGDGLGRLRAMCRPGARLEIVVGEGDLTLAPDELRERYADAGLRLDARPAPAAEVATLGTTWAKRLARSDPGRRFWRLSAPPAGT